MIGLFLILLALMSVAGVGFYWIDWDIQRKEPFWVHCWQDLAAVGAKLWPWAKKKSNRVQVVRDV